MVLLEPTVVTNTCLGRFVWIDETFVLDCYKGKKLDTGAARKPRKHGTKALKVVFPVNTFISARCSSAKELGTFLIRIRWMDSFIKKRYELYRGVASKYTNRYNTLFATNYRKAKPIIGWLTETVFEVTSTNYYHNNKNDWGIAYICLLYTSPSPRDA